MEIPVVSSFPIITLLIFVSHSIIKESVHGSKMKSLGSQSAEDGRIGPLPPPIQASIERERKKRTEKREWGRAGDPHILKRANFQWMSPWSRGAGREQPAPQFVSFDDDDDDDHGFVCLPRTRKDGGCKQTEKVINYYTHDTNFIPKFNSFFTECICWKYNNNEQKRMNVSCQWLFFVMCSQRNIIRVQGFLSFSRRSGPMPRRSR